MFCSYCGSSIIMTNENEYIYRHVDEAGIKQAETERIIRIKELELEERAENRSRKGRSIAFGIALFFVVIGVICVATGVYAGGGAIAIGGWIALFTFISGDESKKRNQDGKMTRSGKIKLIGTATEYEKKDYRTVQSAYRALGFRDVSVVNLRDLRAGLLKKPGTVEEVTINGEKPERNTWYDPSSAIVITYHGFWSDREREYEM